MYENVVAKTDNASPNTSEQWTEQEKTEQERGHNTTTV